jgi:peptidyl-tRNA hydrolase
MNNDINWLREKATLEDNCIISVGGLVMKLKTTYKMVICFRKDLDTPIGKLLEQAAHAPVNLLDKYASFADVDLDRINIIEGWKINNQTTECVWVKSLEKLQELATQALEENLLFAIEVGEPAFNDNKRVTTLVILGESTKVAKLTKKLRLI